IGAELAYSNDIEHSESDIYIYPKVKASYDIAGDYLTIYAGADGGLKQNSYYELAQRNPYIAPEAFIAPTNKAYDIFGGVKGKFTEDLSYDFRASYISEEHKPLFLHRGYDFFNPADNREN